MPKPSLKVPPLDPALIDFLDKAHPERCPDPFETRREIWMKAGERRLVRKLLHQLQQQQDQDVSIRA